LPQLPRPLTAAFAAAGIAGFLAMGACAPQRSTTGYQAIEHQPKDIKVDVDTKSTVLDQLGSPSAQSTFDSNVWFYISQNAEVISYHKARVTKRSVVAITFNKQSEKVTKIDTLSLKDGKLVAYNGHETPTRGRELSVFEQLIGTVGRGGLLPQQDPVPGQRPGQ